MCVCVPACEQHVLTQLCRMWHVPRLRGSIQSRQVHDSIRRRVFGHKCCRLLLLTFLFACMLVRFCWTHCMLQHCCVVFCFCVLSRAMYPNQLCTISGCNNGATIQGCSGWYCDSCFYKDANSKRHKDVVELCVCRVLLCRAKKTRKKYE